VNAGADSKILNNTLYNTSGIDMRFAQTTGLVANNLLNGKIRDRDGGTSMKMNNLEEVALADFGAWFVDPAAYDFTLKDGAAIVDLGLALAEVPDDYCGNDRDDGKHDIGAIEYDGDGCVGGVPVESGGGSGGTSTGGDESGGSETGVGSTGGAGTSGETGSSPTSGATSSPTSGETDGPTSGGESGGGLTTGTGGSSGSAGDTGATGADSGCACRGGSSTGGAGALLGLLLLGLGRSRRR
jgi:MYXO-CTERM domain-containing protein